MPGKLTSSQNRQQRVRIGRCRRRVDAVDGASGARFLFERASWLNLSLALGLQRRKTH